VNRSSKPLTLAETRVLARGFKFRPSLEHLPIEDYIVATETVIKSAKLPIDVAMTFEYGRF
jgi:hypothetical protein